MFPGRAGCTGRDADVSKELPLFGVGLVVRGALTPEPVGDPGVDEVAEAVLGLEEVAVDVCERAGEPSRRPHDHDRTTRH
ncbi:hypothetical protein ABZX85_21210 [Streptomyces sp. NPDC004539]|uniref:hypothetical protein n=1 Tax=Streptomyces sp. NPDC004539 TaxID=3154280 RepID=UPI0033A3BE33